MVSWLRRYGIHGNSQPAVLCVHCKILMLKTAFSMSWMLGSSWMQRRRKFSALDSVSGLCLWVGWSCTGNSAQKLTGSGHLYSIVYIMLQITLLLKLMIKLNHSCARCLTGLWSMPALWVMCWRLGPHLVPLSLGCSLHQRINPLNLLLNRLLGDRRNRKMSIERNMHVTRVWL